MSTSVGIWMVGEGGPIRVSKASVDLEKDLEGWIASDPSLLAEGLRIVGRQVRLEAGPLDLLGIDAQGRWVVVELKRERLYRETVAQALDYAACLRSIDAQELLDKLIGHLGDFGDRDELIGLVSEQLQDDGEREIAVTLVGTGVDPGLERVVGYLGRYDLPVSVVTFDVFALDGGRRFLVRDVIEEQVSAPVGPSKKKSIDEIRRQASLHGVRPSFDRIVSAAENAGLFVRPYVRSVMITPPSHKNRFLMALRPSSGGRLRVSFGPEAFAEFYSELTAGDVIEALGAETVEELAGDRLATQVEAIETFLAELPPLTQGGPDSPSADAAAVKAIAACVKPGEWTTYGDISVVATGHPSSAMAIENIARTDPEFPNAHRVLNRSGKVPGGWTDGQGGGPEIAYERLSAEGVASGPENTADPARRVPIETLGARVATKPAVTLE